MISPNLSSNTYPFMVSLISSSVLFCAEIWTANCSNKNYTSGYEIKADPGTSWINELSVKWNYLKKDLILINFAEHYYHFIIYNHTKNSINTYQTYQRSSPVVHRSSPYSQWLHSPVSFLEFLCAFYRCSNDWQQQEHHCLNQHAWSTPSHRDYYKIKEFMVECHGWDEHTPL